ncbi:ABC transporter permease [candidate division CSSED10-310 bacterium]|uniref:ABC transporter permease n=1 Tax=candidate division CSSED10-310 bacterium TaxID=2855610 RepID=A0ABV6Z5F1_UNCC1
MFDRVFKHQEKTLTDRYLDCKLGEFKTTALLLFQAPFIAALIAYRFHDVTVTKFLYFSLALSSLWFGCTNAAREIIKERSLFGRERLYNLNIGAYLISKIKILSMLGFIQSLFLIVIVNYYVSLDGFIFFHIMNAFFTTLGGIALGLLISTLVNSVHQADALIPIVLIPQILFSPIVMPERFLSGWAPYIEKLMILKWSYSAFIELVSKQGQISNFLAYDCIMMIMVIVMITMAGFFLKHKKIIY